MNKITKTILFTLLVLISFTLVGCDSKSKECDKEDIEVIKNTIKYPQINDIECLKRAETIYDITLSENYYVVCLYSNITLNSTLRYMMTMANENNACSYEFVRYDSLSDVEKKHNKLTLNEVWLVYDATVKDVITLETSNKRYYKEFTSEYENGLRNYDLSFKRFLFQTTSGILNGERATLLSYNISSFREVKVENNKEYVLFAKTKKYPNGRVIDVLKDYFINEYKINNGGVNYYDIYEGLFINDMTYTSNIHTSKYDVEVESVTMEYEAFIQKTKELFK